MIILHFVLQRRPARERTSDSPLCRFPHSIEGGGPQILPFSSAIFTTVSHIGLQCRPYTRGSHMPRLSASLCDKRLQVARHTRGSQLFWPSANAADPSSDCLLHFASAKNLEFDCAAHAARVGPRSLLYMTCLLHGT